MLVAETNKYTTVEQFTARETDRDRILRDFAEWCYRRVSGNEMFR